MHRFVDRVYNSHRACLPDKVGPIARLGSTSPTGSLLPQGERLLAGTMDEWDPSKYGGNFGTIYSPTRRQTRTNKVPLLRWASALIPKVQSGGEVARAFS